MNRDTLQVRRQEQWRQTSATRLTGPEEAFGFIEQVGIVTLYPASEEIPNLLHAYTGDPDIKPDAKWDSVAGEAYTWRWTLGKKEAAFYSTLVQKRPTWVAWPLLPAVFRLLRATRTPKELYASGELSQDALRIAEALEASGEALSTGELRRLAGFPTGKSERASYLKAVEELERHLLLAKVFSPEPDDLEQYHTLTGIRYATQVAEAEQLSCTQALERLLRVYLASAVYALPKPLAKHLHLPEAAVRAGLERLVEAQFVEAVPDGKETIYVLYEPH